MAETPPTSSESEGSGNEVLFNIIEKLQGALAVGRGTLAVLGEEENDKFHEEARKYCADLELSPDEEEEPPIPIAMQIQMEAEKLTKRKKNAAKRKARKEEIDRAERDALEQNRVFKISRSDFSAFIKTLTRHLKPTTTWKNFRAEVMESWDDVRSRMKEKGLKMHFKVAVEALCRLEDILSHCARNFFEAPKLRLDGLTIKDHLKILCKYFDETPNEGAEGAPLKIVTKTLIRTTNNYMRKKDAAWKPNRYLLRAAGM